MRLKTNSTVVCQSAANVLNLILADVPFGAALATNTLT